MEMSEIIKEVETIAETRKQDKTFANPISRLKRDFKTHIKGSAKDLKPNPILKLSWYKNMVDVVEKNPNIIQDKDNYYKYGVYVKFSGFLSIRYLPYVVKVSKPIKKVKNVKPLIPDTLKNFGRCAWCKRGINLKNKKEYGYRYDKLLCAGCLS